MLWNSILFYFCWLKVLAQAWLIGARLGFLGASPEVLPASRVGFGHHHNGAITLTGEEAGQGEGQGKEAESIKRKAREETKQVKREGQREKGEEREEGEGPTTRGGTPKEEPFHAVSALAF